MTLNWDDIVARGVKGVGISEQEALAITSLESEAELEALMDAAETVRRHHKADYVNTCGITNAKSGRCPEKCNFCSQSAHFSTAAPQYTTKESDAIVADAQAAFEGGVREFSIVMAGRQIDTEQDLSTLEDAFRRIREETGMQTCASLGLMKKEERTPMKTRLAVRRSSDLGGDASLQSTVAWRGTAWRGVGCGRTTKADVGASARPTIAIAVGPRILIALSFGPALVGRSR